MREYVEKAMTFAEYLDLIDGLLADGKTTGPVQSDEMLNYARLNRQRMLRLGKTVELDEGVRSAIASLEVKWIWLVIIEGWCGDGAQNVPVIEKLAAANDGIVTRYILRDENPDLMDEFLTDGSRSIPKMIAIDADTFQVLSTWGPRPAAAQRHFEDLKSKGMQKADILELMQRWYNEDRSRSMQAEFVGLATGWMEKAVARTAAA
jgi:hypothetical protein